VGEWVRIQCWQNDHGRLDIEAGHAACCPEFQNNDPAPTRPLDTGHGGIRRGCRLRWPGSGSADHIALGPALTDPRGGRVLVRVRSPSKQHMDIAVDLNKLRLVDDPWTRTVHCLEYCICAETLTPTMLALNQYMSGVDGYSGVGVDRTVDLLLDFGFDPPEDPRMFIAAQACSLLGIGAVV